MILEENRDGWANEPNLSSSQIIENAKLIAGLMNYLRMCLGSSSEAPNINGCFRNHEELGMFVMYPKTL